MAIGKSSLLYEEMYKRVVKKYEKLKNLKIVGFVDERTKSEILAKSWILCLPSIREGLPLAILEALAHKAAILSSVNPDSLTEKFGYWVRSYDFMEGFNHLLRNNRWNICGENGYKYVSKNHELKSVINQFVQLISLKDKGR